ncbi:hypothetical protein Vretifemale_20123, partial [Volvox reticuliferus]
LSLSAFSLPWETPSSLLISTSSCSFLSFPFRRFAFPSCRSFLSLPAVVSPCLRSAEFLPSSLSSPLPFFFVFPFSLPLAVPAAAAPTLSGRAFWMRAASAGSGLVFSSRGPKAIASV